MLFQNLGSCSNFVGSNAVIENNGTFGSGTRKTGMPLQLYRVILFKFRR